MVGISKRMLDDEESHVGSPGLRRQTNDGQECGAGTWGEASIHSALLPLSTLLDRGHLCYSAAMIGPPSLEANPLQAGQLCAPGIYWEKRRGAPPRERITFEQIKLRHSLSLIAFISSVTQYVWFLETIQKIEEGQHGGSCIKPLARLCIWWAAAQGRDAGASWHSQSIISTLLPVQPTFSPSSWR